MITAEAIMLVLLLEYCRDALINTLHNDPVLHGNNVLQRTQHVIK